MDPRATDSDLPESRLYTFIDGPREHALYFLEGQRLIHDVVMTHSVQGLGLSFFRDVILSVQPMISLLGGGEQLGFYIDSESPLFRLKIETTHDGDTRCTLVPEDLSRFPDDMHGVVRVDRRSATGAAPYQSILAIEGLALDEVVNRVLRDSWQMPCRVVVSDASDQSVLLHQLPPLRSDDTSRFSPEALDARLGELRDGLDLTLGRAALDPGEIEAAFASLGFRLIASRGVRLRCACSAAKVIKSLRLVGDRGELFAPGQSQLEVICEYCKRRFLISRKDLDDPPEIVH
jgi:redox-regulated HSP33 family molecular chaperone